MLTQMINRIPTRILLGHFVTCKRRVFPTLPPTRPTTNPSTRVLGSHLSTSGLLALNPGSPSSCSSFSTPSVADSVEFNETNAKGSDVIDKEMSVIDQRAPNDTVMNDTESESEIQEISAGADE